MAPKAEDRRVKRTRKLLRDALLDLMLEKGYEAVTVQTIVDRANVGRSTFYAHFLDKRDLLESGHEQLRSALSREQPAAPGLLAFSLPMFRHAQANHRLYRSLVVKGGGAAVTEMAQRTIADLVQGELAALLPPGATPPVPLELVVLHVVSSFLALLQWWLDHNMPHQPEEMDRLFRALVMPSLTALGWAP